MQGGGVTCKAGGNWTCGLEITPGLVYVTGQQISTGEGTGISCKGKPVSSPYALSFPAITNHDQHLDLIACACRNYPSFADAGAPELCFEDCPL